MATSVFMFLAAALAVFMYSWPPERLTQCLVAALVTFMALPACALTLDWTVRAFVTARGMATGRVRGFQVRRRLWRWILPLAPAGLLVSLWVAGQWPLRIRLELSRGELETAAARVSAGETLRDSRLGSFSVLEASSLSADPPPWDMVASPGSRGPLVWFEIGPLLIDPYGLIYAPHAELESAGSPRLRRVAAGWYSVHF